MYVSSSKRIFWWLKIGIRNSSTGKDIMDTNLSKLMLVLDCNTKATFVYIHWDRGNSWDLEIKGQYRIPLLHICRINTFCEVLLHNQLCKQIHIQQYKYKTKQTVPEYANLSILIQRILIWWGNSHEYMCTSFAHTRNLIQEGWNQHWKCCI
jgi:hypothetical protein